MMRLRLSLLVYICVMFMRMFLDVRANVRYKVDASFFLNILYSQKWHLALSYYDVCQILSTKTSIFMTKVRMHFNTTFI